MLLHVIAVFFILYEIVGLVIQDDARRKKSGMGSSVSILSSFQENRSLVRKMKRAQSPGSSSIPPRMNENFKRKGL